MESRLNKSSVLIVSDHKTTHSAFIMLVFWFLIAMSWWLLAFWPASDINSWLTRTQLVCFGKMPGQPLPLSGWILLFGGPIFLLAAMLVVYGSEIIQSIRTIQNIKSGKIIIFLISTIFINESAWIVFRVNQDSKAFSTNAPVIDDTQRLPEHYLRTHTPITDFKLINQMGEKITNKQLTGKPSILTFVYAHCATMCPMLLKQVSKSIDVIGSNNVRGIFITLDPWRDKPSRLLTLAEQWKIPKGSLLLSGDVSSVTKVHSDFKIPAQREEKTGEITHPGLVFVIDKKGEIAYTFNSPPVQWLVDAYNKVAQE